MDELLDFDVVVIGSGLSALYAVVEIGKKTRGKYRCALVSSNTHTIFNPLIYDYVEGEIKLYDVTIIGGSFFDNRIEVRVEPASNDVNAERSLYLDVDISNSKFTVYPE